MKTASRDQLYEQVWSKPMTKVAVDYGITGTALKKICDRHEIPTPERGYWAKLEHGKPVMKRPLPKLTNVGLAEVHIVGRTGQQLSEEVQGTSAKVLQRLKELASSELEAATSYPAVADVIEAPALAATRRAICKARCDGQGFATARGRGVMPLKIAPRSIERGLQVLSRLFALAETLGHRPKATDGGLVLVTEGEAIAFSLEEKPERIPHEPSPAELKRRDERLPWGLSGTSWPKYDHVPSGRLAIIIDANPYSGARRTYSDRKTRLLEEILPEILVGFVEHAALIKERRRADEERKRQWEEAEAHRHREEAFKAKEKRRMEFANAIHEQLAERAKLSAVLAHLESVADDEPGRTEAMTAWVRRRLQQIDALISPLFLDISARFLEVDFGEQSTEAGAEGVGRYVYYSRPVELQYWSIDEEKGLATSRTALQWLAEAGFTSEPERDQGNFSADEQ